MTTFYKKQGRKYIPVPEYDQELNDSLWEGTHLTVTTTGSRTRRYNIDQALAPLIAAGIIAEDAIVKVIQHRISLQPVTKPLTPEQRAAWLHMQEVWGDTLCRLQGDSIMDAVRAGVTEMIAQASELLTNPALKQSHQTVSWE